MSEEGRVPNETRIWERPWTWGEPQDVRTSAVIRGCESGGGRNFQRSGDPLILGNDGDTAFLQMVSVVFHKDAALFLMRKVEESRGALSLKPPQVLREYRTFL